MSKLRIYGDNSGYMDIQPPATADNSTVDLSEVITTSNATSKDIITTSNATSKNIITTSNLETNISSTYNSGRINKKAYYNSGYGSGARLTITSANSWTALNLGGTGLIGNRVSAAGTPNNVLSFTKVSNNSHLLISVNIPAFVSGGASGVGIRCIGTLNTSDNNSYATLDLTDGPANSWGALGYGGSTSGIINYTFSTQTSSIASSYLTHTGETGFYFDVRVFNANDTVYFIDYDNTYAKMASFVIEEIEQ